MKAIYRLQPELLGYLEAYQHWLFGGQVQAAVQRKLRSSSPLFKQENRPEDSCGLEYLSSIDHGAHEGFPQDFYGVDLNYKNVQKESAQFDADFFADVRKVDHELDDNLQNTLGARSCALKAFYPPQGYLSWHTNWNAPGYVILFTYSAGGKGYWRHIDPLGSRSHVPNPARMVQMDDVAGWHCKVGYFGQKEETDRLVWHCAYTSEPRVTVSYLVQDKTVWEDMVDEIEGFGRP